MMARFAKRLGANYLWGVVNFGLGALLASINAFIILTAIYHAGVCR